MCCNLESTLWVSRFNFIFRTIIPREINVSGVFRTEAHKKIWRPWEETFFFVPSPFFLIFFLHVVVFQLDDTVSMEPLEKAIHYYTVSHLK